jgi:hypothetical protein
MRYIYEMLQKIKTDLDALESPFAEIIPLPARTLRREELDPLEPAAEAYLVFLVQRSLQPPLSSIPPA